MELKFKYNDIVQLIPPIKGKIVKGQLIDIRPVNMFGRIFIQYVMFTPNNGDFLVNEQDIVKTDKLFQDV